MKKYNSYLNQVKPNNQYSAAHTSLELSTSSEMFSKCAHTKVTFPISRSFFQEMCVYISVRFGKCLFFKSPFHKRLYAHSNRTGICIEFVLDSSLVSRGGDYRVHVNLPACPTLTYYPPLSASQNIKDIKVFAESSMS